MYKLRDRLIFQLPDSGLMGLLKRATVFQRGGSCGKGIVLFEFIGTSVLIRITTFFFFSLSSIR